MNCSQCGTLNPKGTLFCNICFAPLISPGTSSTPGMSDQAGGISQPLQLVSPGAGRNSPRLIILENAQPTGQSISLPMPPYNPSILIGRTDLKNSIVVDIDVNNYGGYDKGVSRKHALLLYSNNTYFIEDWESTLGTFVNKKKLQKGMQTTIKGGDEIRFANLVTRFEE